MIRVKSLMQIICIITMLFLINTNLLSADFDTAITTLNDGNYEEVKQNKGIIIEELSEAQEKMALNLSKRC
ncbi:MAG: hypothetical protein CML37_04600 [Rhodobacteraceae bacterium]|nr:hypothetical protein [Paracoccaceae bacterium]